MLAETSSAAAGITATVEAAAMCSSLSVEPTAATSVAAVAIISGAASTFDISVLPREELEPYPRALSAPVHEHDTAPNTVDKVADLIHLRQGPQARLLGGYGAHFYVQLQHHPQDFRWPTRGPCAVIAASGLNPVRFDGGDISPPDGLRRQYHRRSKRTLSPAITSP
jgi:hypothetical protein